ncbi:pentatricopeptide (PPR) repeat-containing protein [Striga asiatica]|uniref:Pentatricopeptide (PPR) repeat-containing protein n=1 Tax=Striga asiatica TaxID=4170 RepID=A0A5A7PSS5_STRAF|nr:pentatricopeptide (PPR) repeat-containing protein [Striga asiatica]
MGPRPEHLRLRRLLDESLRSFSDITSINLTEELEKDLLIALSQVLRRIKQWTCDFDSDEESLTEPVDDTDCSVSLNSHTDSFHSLNKFVGDLTVLLNAESRYAQLLVENILVAISEFLLASDSCWDDFMQSLCLCLEGEISKSLLDTKSASWPVMASIFRVLRNILKFIKQDCDNKLVEAHLVSIISLLLNLPWNVLREAYFEHKFETLEGSSRDASVLQKEVVKSKEITIFFGNLIQFLCSLVSHISSLDDGVGFPTVMCRTIDLVPKLTMWCNTELQNSLHVRISHYFRHKVLILMVKLSSNTLIEQTVHVKWIDLLSNHFQDLLLQPISRGESVQVDFLEGSPFCTSIVDNDSQNVPSCHLQRLTVFLFLKRSLSQNVDSECCTENMGLAKLYEWLRTQIPHDILVNDELYFDRCVRFTLSFLQLFMHEDDILFQMLLQLFRVPFCPERRVTIKDDSLADVKNHSFFLVSDVFNPIHIFHLFLAQIHYDHQVFLDYLISKDTGSSCAEYLLRSLRVLCNSWSSFVEFPGLEENLGRLSRKRQRVLVDSTHGTKDCTNNTLPFEAARDCLGWRLLDSTYTSSTYGFKTLAEFVGLRKHGHVISSLDFHYFVDSNCFDLPALEIYGNSLVLSTNYEYPLHGSIPFFGKFTFLRQIFNKQGAWP